MKSIDYALPENIGAWLHHPVAGDPSFDSFVRDPANPVVVGAPPYEWTVNGSLFVDPPTGDVYLYVGLYPRGYWPAGGARCLVRRAGSDAWEDRGVILSGSPDTFDGTDGQPGAMPDVTVVRDPASGEYHMVYDWADRPNKRGGIAHARAPRPDGPWTRSPAPIHLDVDQSPLLGRYVRVYAASLVHRERDWLIVAMMSTPGNGGGTWALATLVGLAPEGPYGPPLIVICPQGAHYHPAPVEFFPAFVADGYVYAPATSVAANRSYQIVYRAPIERAEHADAWEIVLDGSAWHDEPVPHEALGIWGQTFGGALDGDTLRAMYPAKNGADCGTIGIVSRSWAEPYRRGFVLSAPNAPALGLLLRSYGDFALDAQVAASGPVAVLWGHTAPIGSDPPWHSNMALDPRGTTDCLRLDIAPAEWRLSRVAPDGTAETIAGNATEIPLATGARIAVRHAGGDLAVHIDGAAIWSGRVPGKRGRIALLALPGTIARVESFTVDGSGEPDWITLLASDAVLGRCAPHDTWEKFDTPMLRYGTGYCSLVPGASAKWNWRGCGFRLHAPRGPDFGACHVYVDGVDHGLVDLGAAEPVPSAVVAEGSLSAGRHALVLVAERGVVPLDVFEFLPE